MKTRLFALALALCASPLPLMAQYSGNTRLLAAPNLDARQQSVGTTAASIAPQRDTRQQLTLSVGAANNCAIGTSAAVTLATGFRIQPVAGANVVVHSRAQVFMVCDATTVVSVLDPY